MNIQVFLGYHYRDKELASEVQKQLSLLKKIGIINGWVERVVGGEEEIETTAIEKANIILLLVSQDLIISNYCTDLEVKRAIELHEEGKARVIPILLFPNNSWKQTPLGELKPLPEGAKAVSTWENQEEAFANIASGVAIEVIEFSKSLLGHDCPYFATCVNNLAKLYKKQERYQEAENTFLQAIELRKQILGDRHPDYVASMNNLASLYELVEYYEQAEKLYKEALEIQKEILGDKHVDVATSLNNLALMYYAQKRYKEAEPIYNEALQIRKEVLGKDSPEVAKTLNNLGTLYSSQKRYREAVPVFERALKIAKESLGKDHPTTATIRENLNSHKQLSFWKVIQWYIVFQALYEIFIA